LSVAARQSLLPLTYPLGLVRPCRKCPRRCCTSLAAPGLCRKPADGRSGRPKDAFNDEREGSTTRRGRRGMEQARWCRSRNTCMNTAVDTTNASEAHSGVSKSHNQVTRIQRRSPVCRFLDGPPMGCHSRLFAPHHR
jgi:hypothetical protein